MIIKYLSSGLITANQDRVLFWGRLTRMSADMHMMHRMVHAFNFHLIMLYTICARIYSRTLSLAWSALECNTESRIWIGFRLCFIFDKQYIQGRSHCMTRPAGGEVFLVGYGDKFYSHANTSFGSSF